jgi:hypothetical protein
MLSLCGVLAVAGCGGKSAEAGAAPTSSSSAGAAANGTAGSPGAAGGTADLAGASDGGASAGAASDQPAKLSSGAWNVTLPLTLSGGFEADAERACTSLSLTLDLIDNGDSLSAFLGANGTMLKGSFDRAMDGSLSLAAPVHFDEAPGLGDCSATSIGFDSLTLHAQDTDGDGQLDHLTGVGTGSTTFLFGDEEDETKLAFSLDGVPDQTAPSIDTGNDAHSPLDPIVLKVSEPLESATLSLAGTPVVDFQGPAANDALIQLTTDRVLPFSGSWTLAGTARDFAGLQLEVGGAFTTLADPGLFAQDGFEGLLAATLTNGAAVVDGTSGITMPSGTRALLVPPNGSATLHLAGPASGFKQLTMTFVKLSQVAAGGGVVTAEVAVIGGSKRSTTYLEPKGSETAAISNQQWKLESPPTVLSVPLQEQGTDVAVRFSVIECGGMPCPPSALVIDDLKLE